jgi:hypothetical protein
MPNQGETLSENEQNRGWCFERIANILEREAKERW